MLCHGVRCEVSKDTYSQPLELKLQV